MAQIVNVLLHGIFGYHLCKDHIEAYVPAVSGHTYQVSTQKDGSDAQDLGHGAEYRLLGVSGGIAYTPSVQLSPVVTPMLAATIDEYDKRYCKIILPYPTATDGIRPVDCYKVGSVFAGRDAAPFNALSSFPGMHVFVYELDGKSLGLEDVATTTFLDCSNAVAVETPTTNLHIWCTMQAMKVMVHGEPTELGHYRKGFAAMIDLFPNVEITLEISDGFDPPEGVDAAVNGVSSDDISPEPYRIPTFGKVNCRYANIFVTEVS